MAGKKEVEHRITVRAPADEVYRLVADVTGWPTVFPPTVHVEQRDLGGGAEQIRLWATANGEIKTWTSRRLLDPLARRVEFRQEKSQPPVAEMGGTWIIEPLSASESSVRLLHDYSAVGDDAGALEWIERAVDRNSGLELAALKEKAEAGGDELVFSFDDTVQMGGSAADAYDFLYDAAKWSERLPHVACVRLSEDVADLQLLEMETKAKDGSTHTTTSVRVCFAGERIVYKQTVLPALMSLHTGEWLVRQAGDDLLVTSRHTVAIKPEAVSGVLGSSATISTAKQYVRTALSTNSLATLNHAKAYAERFGAA